MTIEPYTGSTKFSNMFKFTKKFACLNLTSHDGYFAGFHRPQVLDHRMENTRTVHTQTKKRHSYVTKLILPEALPTKSNVDHNITTELLVLSLTFCYHSPTLPSTIGHFRRKLSESGKDCSKDGMMDGRSRFDSFRRFMFN